jgi:hypothetical protein
VRWAKNGKLGDRMESFIEVLGFAFVVSIFIAAFLIYRKGKIRDISNYEIVSFTTSLQTEKAFKAILKSINSSFTIDDIDEDKNQIVLSDKFEYLNGGNYYSVSCKPNGSGTIIEIGIKSKSWGRTDVQLSRFVNLLRVAIIIEE